MKWLLALVAAIACLGARRAEACSCEPRIAVLSEHPRAVLGPDATLYLFVSALFADEELKVAARQASGEVPFTRETVFTGPAYKVERLRLRGAVPGPLTVTVAPMDAVSFQVAPGAVSAPPWRLRRISFENSGLECGRARAFRLESDGPQAAAYRMRWRGKDGVAHEAYFPVEPSMDGEGSRTADHVVDIGASGCGPKWLDLSQAPYLHEVELTMLTFAGEEIVVARGDLQLDATSGALPTFVPVPVIAPRPLASVASVATSATPRWCLLLIGLAGASLGAAVMWGIRRRRGGAAA